MSILSSRCPSRSRPPQQVRTFVLASWIEQPGQSRHRPHPSRQGNSTGIPLSREILEGAGPDRGADVFIDATEGKIVITPVASPRAEAMADFERSLSRCDRTYAILADSVVPHAEVVKWLEPWGTPDELPCPEPKAR